MRLDYRVTILCPAFRATFAPFLRVDFIGLRGYKRKILPLRRTHRHCHGPGHSSLSSAGRCVMPFTVAANEHYARWWLPARQPGRRYIAALMMPPARTPIIISAPQMLDVAPLAASVLISMTTENSAPLIEATMISRGRYWLSSLRYRAAD